MICNQIYHSADRIDLLRAEYIKIICLYLYSYNNTYCSWRTQFVQACDSSFTKFLHTQSA